MQATPWDIEERIVVNASAAAVYAAYADVAGWPRWDPDTREAWLPGFHPGARGRLRPRKGLAVAMELVEARPGQGFTVECPVLGSRMQFGHELRPLPDGGVEVVHRVAFRGWLAGWLRRTVGRDVRAGLPVTLASLKRHVEGLEDGRPACRPPPA